MMLRPFLRRRNARALRDAGRAIDEVVWIQAAGIDHFATIRGTRETNPVLVFLHGGPGASQTIFGRTTLGWENHVTIVEYDQRGTGKTRRRNGAPAPGELTLDRLAKDVVEVVEELRRRLGIDRVILAGSSVGSTFGLKVAAERPDLVSAYIGVDQNSIPEAGDETYRLTLETLRRSGRAKGVRELERIGPGHRRWSQAEFDRIVRWAISADRGIPDMVMDVMFPAMMTSPLHTMRDIHDISTGIEDSMTALYRELVDFDARAVATRFAVPFFVFQGDSDAVTPTEFAREYFDLVTAPVKGWQLAPNCGHLAAFTRPEAFERFLVESVLPAADG
ncbi:alpha/beta hydrolase [Microbacterium sp.]|uniref:alpha/beta fold hydrolase n=1 Tax=Microbacterium sp. TaxID=51671 RepID=UPI00281156CB|nr:alpha/beta hydrolase [Microbacterium sp.]